MRRPSAGWKIRVCTQFEVCPHRVPTAQISSCIALEPESRLPIQPGSGQRIQTGGQTFLSEGKLIQFKEIFKVPSLPLSQITPPLGPPAEMVAVSRT